MRTKRRHPTASPHRDVLIRSVVPTFLVADVVGGHRPTVCRQSRFHTAGTVPKQEPYVYAVLSCWSVRCSRSREAVSQYTESVAHEVTHRPVRRHNRLTSGRCRFVAAVCIAAVFLAAVIPVAASLFSAVLIPLPVLFGAVVSIDAPTPESLSPEPFPTDAPIPSRAPPRA